MPLGRSLLEQVAYREAGRNAAAVRRDFELYAVAGFQLGKERIELGRRDVFERLAVRVHVHYGTGYQECLSHLKYLQISPDILRQFRLQES